MITRIVRFLIVSAATLLACVAIAAIGRRVLDGYQVWTLELTKSPDSPDLSSSDRRAAGTPSMQALLGKIARDPEADVAWFDDRPQPISGTSQPWADRRRAVFEPEAN